MKSPKVDNSGAIAAQQAAAEAQRQATNLQKNFQTDLKTENVAQIIPGTDASMEDTVGGTVKRRRQGGGLASQLGINV